MRGRAPGGFSRQGGAFPSFWIGKFIFLKKVCKNLWSNVWRVLQSHQVLIVPFQIGERPSRTRQPPLPRALSWAFWSSRSCTCSKWPPLSAPSCQSDKQVDSTPRRTRRGSNPSAHMPGRPATSRPRPGPIQRPSRAFSGQRLCDVGEDGWWRLDLWAARGHAVDRIDAEQGREGQVDWGG